MARILVVDDSPTLRKVVTSILERNGYEALAAADGIIALDALHKAEVPFDLVLLDFVMPKMNGFQFCRAVRMNERFAMLPVVLMSAKSDKIRDHFVDQTGAVDAISKPFDAQALIVAIENALRRVSMGRVAAVGPMAAEDLEVSAATDIGQLKARVAQQAASKIAAAVAPLLARVPREAIGDRGQIASALATALSADAARDVSVALRRIDVGEGSLSLAGDLATVPIGAILQMLQVECKTGLLLISNGHGSEVTVTMRSGLIDLVQSRGAGDEFRLGRYFVEEGLVTPAEIDALLRDHRGASIRTGETPSSVVALADAPTPTSDRLPSPVPPALGSSGEIAALKPRVLLGDALLHSGLVSEDQLKEALARQSSELIYEVLRWPKGWFEFRITVASLLARKAKLGLPVASVVMEGFRRVDEWRLVEQGLGSFESKLVRDPVAIDALRLDDLARPERVVLEAIDGDRTVREIIAASHMSSFDACRILLQFLEARIVRRRQQ
jgi:DNA-binding response OmpR family regulator